MANERHFVCLEDALKAMPALQQCWMALQRLPRIAESEIIRHGQWKRTPTSGTLYCSVCDKIPESQMETPHCPECGAKLNPSEAHYG